LEYERNTFPVMCLDGTCTLCPTWKPSKGQLKPQFLFHIKTEHAIYLFDGKEILICHGNNGNVPCMVGYLYRDSMRFHRNRSHPPTSPLLRNDQDNTNTEGTNGTAAPLPSTSNNGPTSGRGRQEYDSCTLCTNWRPSKGQQSKPQFLFHIKTVHGIDRFDEKEIHTCHGEKNGVPCAVGYIVYKSLLSHRNYFHPTTITLPRIVQAKIITEGSNETDAPVPPTSNDGPTLGMNKDGTCTLCPDWKPAKGQPKVKFLFHIKTEHGINLFDGREILICHGNNGDRPCAVGYI